MYMHIKYAYIPMLSYKLNNLISFSTYNAPLSSLLFPHPSHLQPVQSLLAETCYLKATEVPGLEDLPGLLHGGGEGLGVVGLPPRQPPAPLHGQTGWPGRCPLSKLSFLFKLFKIRLKIYI